MITPFRQDRAKVSGLGVYFSVDAVFSRPRTRCRKLAAETAFFSRHPVYHGKMHATVCMSDVLNNIDGLEVVTIVGIFAGVSLLLYIIYRAYKRAVVCPGFDTT